MIKLFRNIRSKLLKENRLTRYFLYALGEIFLVVIGILIALAINNWNEERKDYIKAREYAEALISNIITDSLEIKSLFDQALDKIKEIDKYLDFIEKGDVSPYQMKDTLSTINMRLDYFSIKTKSKDISR